jgi:hypothetical protein
MKQFMFLVLFLSIGILNADQESIGSFTNGILFELKAAEPDSYDHLVGGGSFYDSVSQLDGAYYACEVEAMSLMLKISTDSSWKYNSNAELDIELVLRPDVTVINVENNCVADKTDASKTCTKCGATVVPSLSYIKTGPVLELTGIKKNTRSVIRIDLSVGSDIDCDSHCIKESETGVWIELDVASLPYVRKSYVNSALKRYLQESQLNSDWCTAIDRDIFVLVMFFNSYEVNGDYYQIPLVSVDFINICQIIDCSDLSGCWNFHIPGQIGGTYKGRSCEWYPVSCDDGDSCTIDQCIPPINPTHEHIPPNCTHIDSCGSDEISGYCYDYNSGALWAWDCNNKCKSDADCAILGEDGIYCLFVDDGFCKSGEVEFLMQEEISEDESLKQQRMTGGGLSSIQLGAIIGGCVAFVSILMVVFVIVKRSHQQKINPEIIETLQVPLNQ